jgi:hypothetical protein
VQVSAACAVVMSSFDDLNCSYEHSFAWPLCHCTIAVYIAHGSQVNKFLLLQLCTALIRSVYCKPMHVRLQSSDWSIVFTVKAGATAKAVLLSGSYSSSDSNSSNSKQHSSCAGDLLPQLHQALQQVCIVLRSVEQHTYL